MRGLLPALDCKAWYPGRTSQTSNATTSVCSSICLPNCYAWSTSNPSICTKCEKDFYLMPDGSCVTSCGPGYASVTKPNNDKICSPCDYMCETCSSTPTSCTSCSSPYFLRGSKCIVDDTPPYVSCRPQYKHGL